MFRYKGLVKDLKSENDKLVAEETKMSRKAEQESNNGRILEKYVVDWQKEVQEEQEKVTRCLQENEKLKSQQQNCPRYIRYIPLPHPISRYRLGKEAAKVAKSTTELTATGSHHLASQIAYLPLDMNVPVTAFQEFKSREKAYEKLEELVTDGSSSILGIYGIGGAGKTRLMERITTEAGKKGTFNKVVRANVGNEKLENKTIISIQNQIAGNLGCVFERQDDVGHRAGQLRSSLKQGGKILIILDDVWSRIPLGTIGIMSADGMSSKGGKILLTTRDHEVCQRNDCGDLVKVEPLTPAEAWDMFSETVGAEKIGSLQNISVAEDICKRCGGLPLVILAVGNALKFKPLDSWKDARNQLKFFKIQELPGISKDVYACLKWSFDNLVDDAKACLLLASIFREDADIPIRELVELARGTQLIKADDIRTRVYSMIYILKSASLVLQGRRKSASLVLQGRRGSSQHIKLHDIIRDMARSIATKDYAFLFARSGSLSNNPAEYSARKFLHIDVEEETSPFPSNVKCPELHTLSVYSSSWTSSWKTRLIQDRINGEIFTNLIFLVLVGFSWPKKLSLKSLGELKTLWFDKCDLEFFGETDVKILPEGLENLCIWESPMPEQLNVPELSHLRKLDIYSGGRLCMVPNTISRLSTLEELRLPSNFYIDEECAEGGSLSVLDEISKLPSLTSLQTRSRVSKSSKLATMFSNLREFHLFVGQPPANNRSMNLSPVSVTKSIKLFNHDLVEGYQTLFQKAEEVILYETDFPGSSIGIRDTKEFINLRYMQIENCKAMEYLARISSPQGEIQESLQRSTPFSNLINLKIKCCPSLEYLFCNSVARCLLLLQELHIEDCPLMKEVVRGEGKSDGNIINMSKLRIMILSNLPRLVHFYKDKISCAQIQPLFDGMVVFPSLEKLDITGLNDITDIWGDNHDHASSFSKLKNLRVSFCNKLKNVIPPAMLRSSLTSEVDTHGSNTDLVTGRASEGLVEAVVSHNPYKKLQFFLKKTVRASRSVCRRTPTITEENLNDPSDISVQVPSQNTKVCPLVEMRLEWLSCLEKTGLNFEDQSGAVSLYPDLKKLYINKCKRLENVFIIPCTNGHLMNLEEMSVRNCITMREIIGAGPAGKHKLANGIVFHKVVVSSTKLLAKFDQFLGGGQWGSQQPQG
ncbi:hypothetical protein ACET3Z_008881 [Daucus carota]